jgi:hypothetical protein
MHPCMCVTPLGDMQVESRPDVMSKVSLTLNCVCQLAIEQLICFHPQLAIKLRSFSLGRLPFEKLFPLGGMYCCTCRQHITAARIAGITISAPRSGSSILTPHSNTLHCSFHMAGSTPTMIVVLWSLHRMKQSASRVLPVCSPRQHVQYSCLLGPTKYTRVNDQTQYPTKGRERRPGA